MIQYLRVYKVCVSIGDYLCSFRRDRLTVDQILTIRQMLENTCKFKDELHNLFIDFRQAYDIIISVELWNTMVELSNTSRIDKIRSSVGLGTSLLEPFCISNSLIQGDSTSPLLFNIALEKQPSISIRWWYLYSLYHIDERTIL